MIRKIVNDYYKHSINLRISGNITHETADFITKSLKRLKYKNPKVITLNIDSISGSIVSSEAIVYSITAKAKELGIPYYTFAHSFAIGPAFVILASGNKSFANTHSIIGGLSGSISSVGLAKALEKLKVKYTSISTASVRINPFQDVSKQDEAWAKGIAAHRQKMLIEFLEKNPGGSAIVEKVKTGEIWTGSQGVKEGLVGSLDSLEEVMEKEFKGLKGVEWKYKKAAGGLFLRNLEEFSVEGLEGILQEDGEGFQLLEKGLIR